MFHVSFLTSVFFLLQKTKTKNTWQPFSPLSWHILLSLSAFWVTLHAPFSREPDSSPRGPISENAPPLTHICDNYGICWINGHPHLQHCGRSNLITRHIKTTLNLLWCLWSNVWRYHSSRVKAYVGLSGTNTLTLILSCDLWSLSRL